MDNSIKATPLVILSEESTKIPDVKEQNSDCESEEARLADELVARVNLSPIAAKAWVDLQLGMLQEAGCSLQGIEGFLVDFLDDPQNAEYRNLIEFLLPIVDVSRIGENLLDYPLGLGSSIPTGFLKVDIGYLEMMMRAFPNIWRPKPADADVEKLLKASQVARMLQISESQVRVLALSGELEYSRSQGETGHFRFKPEWLLDYQNQRDEGSPAEPKVV